MSLLYCAHLSQLKFVVFREVYMKLLTFGRLEPTLVVAY